MGRKSAGRHRSSLWLVFRLPWRSSRFIQIAIPSISQYRSLIRDGAECAQGDAKSDAAWEFDLNGSRRCIGGLDSEEGDLVVARTQKPTRRILARSENSKID